MTKLINQLGSLLVLALALLTFFFFIGRTQGRGAFIVLSGSMEPAYPVGGVVFTKPLNFSELTVGDAITFRSQGKDNKVVTHRIIEINQQEGFARTQGDANKAPDGQVVLPKDIIGKVTSGVPYLGYGLVFLQSHLGKWLMLMIVISSLIIYVIRRFILTKKSTITEVKV